MSAAWRSPRVVEVVHLVLVRCFLSCDQIPIVIDRLLSLVDALVDHVQSGFVAPGVDCIGFGAHNLECFDVIFRLQLTGGSPIAVCLTALTMIFISVDSNNSSAGPGSSSSKLVCHWVTAAWRRTAGSRSAGALGVGFVEWEERFKIKSK